MLKDFTLSLELEPTENRVVQTAAIFWSHDVNTAKIYIELLRKGTPIILNKDVTVRVMMLFDDDNKSEHIYTAKIEDELKGLVSVTLEESMRMYVGQVTCGVYVDYQNEEKTDNGYFAFGMRRSLLDKDMPELQKLYVSDFENSLIKWEYTNKEISENAENLDKKLKKIEDNIQKNDLVTNDDLDHLKKKIELINADALKRIEKNYFLGKPISDYTRLKIDELKKNIKNEEYELSIIHVCDAHYERTSYSDDVLNHYQNIIDFIKENKVDLIVSNGDNVNGESEKTYLYQEAEAISAAVLSNGVTDGYILEGNHDSGEGLSKKRIEETLTRKELSVLFGGDSCYFNENRSGESLYFYKDYDDLRVIGLNTSDVPCTLKENGELKYPKISNFGFQEKQLTWLANEALQTDKTVVIFMHAPPSNIIKHNETFYNEKTFVEILDCFKSGKAKKIISVEPDFETEFSVNFKNEGNIAAVFVGHVHKDIAVKHNEVLYISTLCSLPYPRPERFGDREDAWDVILISRKNKSLKLFRFGDGENREFYYGGS